MLRPSRGFLLLLLWLASVTTGTSPARAQNWTSLTHQPSAALSFCLLLTDGTVMCQSATSWYKLTPDITGSYLNSTWSQIASMPSGYEPNVYASAVLADGRVIVVGGEYSTTGAVVLSNSGAIYDPKVNTWALLNPPAGWSYIGDASAVVLPNGKFLLGSKLDTRMAFLDPVSLTWTEVPFTGKQDAFNSEENWTLLPDGSIFTVDVKSAPLAERFIPSLSEWVSAGNTPVSLPSPPDEGPIAIAPGVIYTPPGDMGAAVLRPDGTVFAEGGNGHTAIYTPPPANSTAPGSWVQGPDFPAGLEVDDGPAVLLPSGHVLAVASPGDSGLGLAFYEFDGTNLIPVPQNLNGNADATNYTSLLLLPTGQVLLVDASTLVQIYTPSTATTYNTSWTPVIASFPATLTNGSTYPITGTQFNGLSQASTFGDENQNATNYPLIRITNNASGHVFYAKTHDHSTMGVATGSATASTNFDVPANTELGASTLVVVANGIPSLPAAVTVTSTTLPTVTLNCPASKSSLGISYSSALNASGGKPPFSFSVASGILPPGLTLTSNNGNITGTPNTAGSYNFSAQVTDSSGQTAGIVTALCSIGVPQPGSGPSANFQGQDTTTRGSWKGVYGKDGWIIANDSNSPPAYATVTPAGAATWTWSPQSVDPRALQTGTAGNYRILSTFYSSSTFTFEFNPNDTLTHQVALYLLDLDTRSRAETVSILDASNNNAILDSEAASNFNGGIYFIWTIKGHVLIQVTYTGGLNAVLSGLFFDTPAGGTANTPPTVSITNPPPGVVSGTVSLSAMASATTAGAATIASLQYQLDGTNLGAAITGNGPTYSAQWATTGTTNGAHTVSAVATDSLGQTGSASVKVTVSNGGSASGSSASFLKTDATTQGNWVSAYGQDGYVIANDNNSPPAYATVTPAGASTWTWYPATSDPRALWTNSSSTSRVASTFYSASSFTFDINVSDGQTHQLALYLLDLDTTTRNEKISILDATSNSVLDTRTFSSFQNGIYGVWNLQGHVLIQVVNNGGLNAVVGGLFFDGGATATTPFPVVSLTNPAPGSVSGSVTISASATSSAGVASVQFQIDGANFGSAITGSGPTFSTSWTTTSVSNGSHTLTAIATDNLGQATTSPSITVTVANGTTSAAATFVKFDNTTQGTWTSPYGQDGYLIANDSSSPPAYAAINPVSASLWTWAASTTDPRALQTSVSATGRIASTYYSSTTFSFDVNLSDGQSHQVALYCVDFDTYDRSQKISILDATSNAVLNSETLANFHNGVWAVWNLQGHVIIQITDTGGVDGVVSGLFFGPGGATTTATPPTVSVTAPPPGGVSGNVTLQSTASSSIGISSVQFQLDGITNLGAPISSSPYAYVWNSTKTSNGSHILTAVATDTLSQQTISSGVAINVNNVDTGGTATASFVKKDVSTEGTWKTHYGQDGAIIANDTNNPPAYAAVNFGAAAQFTWAITQDPRALQQGTGSARTASTFYAPSGFVIDLNLGDGNSHQLALYFLDWDGAGRAQVVTILDSLTQKVLDTELISAFQQGTYLVWNLQGHVTIQVNSTAGPNAVVSGLFLASGV